MNRKFFSFLAVAALVCAATSVQAGDPLYTISLSSASGTSGSTINVQAILDNNGGDIAGWSYGVCSDPAVVTVNGTTGADINNEGTATVKNGGPADFNEKAIFADGWTQGVVICFTGCAVVPGGTLGFVMASADYTITAPAPADPAGSDAYPGAFAYCDTLGNPPVSTVVVVAGASIVPFTAAGDLTVVGDPCAGSNFGYIAPDAGPFNYPAPNGIGGLGFSVGFSIEDLGVPQPCDPDVTQGFSMGCSNDPALMEPTAVNPTLPFAPDFAESGVFPNGWTIGVVYSFTGANTLTFPAPAEVVSVDYAGVAGALMGVEGPTTTPLTWDSGLGSPPVSNVVVVGGGSFAAAFDDGSVTFNGTTTEPFQAGDCNGDSITNIADIIWALSELFSGGPASNCPIACDANGDGFYDAADPIWIATYIFLGGPPPVGPMGCDVVPGQTPADCTVATCTP